MSGKFHSREQMGRKSCWRWDAAAQPWVSFKFSMVWLSMPEGMPTLPIPEYQGLPFMPVT